MNLPTGRPPVGVRRRACIGTNTSEGYPPDTGYTIGFHIVQGYLARHPGVSFAALAGMSTATVFDGSGYSG